MNTGRRRTVLFHHWHCSDDACAQFFNQLAKRLDERNVELVLFGSDPRNELIQSRYFRFPSALGLIRGRNYPSLRDIDPAIMDETIAAEKRWYINPMATSDAALRRAHGVGYLNIATLLHGIAPDLVVVWNGEHPLEKLMQIVAKKAGCPILHVERGAFPGSLHLDDTGILAGSRAGVRTMQEASDLLGNEAEIWITRLDRLAASVVEEGLSSWAQPESEGVAELRLRLKVPNGAKIVLFAGQVDEDTQRFLFAPQFSTNLEAFKVFLKHLPNTDDVFVLGKHHPKATSDPANYERALGRRGRWVTDASMSDCLELADYVAAVNSTTLVEGVMRGKPALALGGTLLGGKGIVYELDPNAAAKDCMQSWLSKVDFSSRLSRWRLFSASMLKEDLFFIDQRSSRRGLQDAAALAERLLPPEGDGPDWEMAAPRLSPLEMVACNLDVSDPVAVAPAPERRAEESSTRGGGWSFLKPS